MMIFHSILRLPTLCDGKDHCITAVTKGARDAVTSGGKNNTAVKFSYGRTVLFICSCSTVEDIYTRQLEHFQKPNLTFWIGHILRKTGI